MQVFTKIVSFHKDCQLGSLSCCLGKLNYSGLCREVDLGLGNEGGLTERWQFASVFGGFKLKLAVKCTYDTLTKNFVSKRVPIINQQTSSQDHWYRLSATDFVTRLMQTNTRDNTRDSTSDRYTTFIFLKPLKENQFGITTTRYTVSNLTNSVLIEQETKNYKMRSFL